MKREEVPHATTYGWVLGHAVDSQELERVVGTFFAHQVKTDQVALDGKMMTMFDFPKDIRRLIYTTNTVESYHRQLRKVIKIKATFPNPEAARKLLYLATRNIVAKWTTPIFNWVSVLDQLAIRPAIPFFSNSGMTYVCLNLDQADPSG